MTKLNLRDWLWVGYPIVVVVFMMIGINFLLGGGQADVMQLLVRQDEVEADKLRAEVLRGKLEVLKNVDPARARNELEVLLQAVPPSRAVWYLINELNAAAGDSGMRLVGYRGSVGDVKEASESGSASPAAELAADAGLMLTVEYDAADVTALATGLAQLERMLPLVKIVKVDFAPGVGSNVQLTVEGAWKAWEGSVRDAAAPLPPYTAEVQAALVKLEAFEKVNYEPPETSPATGEAEVEEAAETATGSGVAQ